MKRYLQTHFILALWLGLMATAYCQTPAERLSVPYSDPSQPGTVKLSLLTGSITVKGYSGKEVIVDAVPREAGERPGKVTAKSAGLKRIPNGLTGLTVEEENNVVTISAGFHQSASISLEVPFKTNLVLRTVNSGNIEVDQVQGDIEISTLNGAATLTRISGSVVAHALNKDLKVGFAAVDPQKPMSFSSLNGDIDVTLPADARVNLTMKSDFGEIFSDFDIKMDVRENKPEVENSRAAGGKYRIRMDRTTRGTINGGGPNMQIKTLNGNIYIRKTSA